MVLNTSACLIQTNYDNSKNKSNGSPSLLPMAYYNIYKGSANDSPLNIAKNNIAKSCNNSNNWNCYSGNVKINRPTNDNIKGALYDNYIKNVQNEKHQKCNYVNYLMASGESNSNIITSIASSSTNALDQIKYLSCQLIQARTKQYNSSALMTNNVFSIKEIFTSFKRAKIILLCLLVLTLYILYLGSFQLLKYVLLSYYNIKQSGASNFTIFFMILFIFIIIYGLFYGMYHAEYRKNLDNNMYDITNSSFGDKNIKLTKNSVGIYILMMIVNVLILFLSYYFYSILQDSNNSILNMSFLFLIIFIMIILIMFGYYASFYYLDDEETKNKFFIKNSLDSCSISNTSDFKSYIRKRFIIFTIILIVLSSIFINSNSDNNKTIVFGNILVIITIIYIIILNWFIGLHYFMFYPVIIYLLRFIRSFIENYKLFFGTFTRNTANKDTYIYKKQKTKISLDNSTVNNASWGLIFGSILKIIIENKNDENLKNLKHIFENIYKQNYTSNKIHTGPLLILYTLINRLNDDDTTYNSTYIYVFTAILILFTVLIILGTSFGSIKNFINL